MGALSGLSPNLLLPQMMGHIIEGLSKPALSLVTKEEHAIMLTPEGQLYDQSIIQK